MPNYYMRDDEVIMSGGAVERDYARHLDDTIERIEFNGASWGYSEVFKALDSDGYEDALAEHIRECVERYRVLTPWRTVADRYRAALAPYCLDHLVPDSPGDVTALAQFEGALIALDATGVSLPGSLPNIYLDRLED